MRIFKRVLSVVLVCMMILPLGISSFAAIEAPDIADNWTPMAAKYSAGTWKLIAPKRNNYEITTTGFGFTKDADGGVKITTPTYEEFNGTYGVSVINSKAATPLDGLSVVIQPDEFDSMIDTIDAGNSLNVIWTENPITELAGFNEASKGYDTGMYTAVNAYSNGLRHIIPTVEGATPLTPASQAPEGTTNGKALSVRVTLDKAIGDNYAPVATSVSIVYYDGYYINDDGHPGYRWTFAAMNHEDSKLGDASSTSTVSEAIDLSNGLAINVRADEELGFIVNINGYDYYKGEEIGFFPDCDTNWVGYKTNELTDESILNNDPIWATSMRCARNDIDLSGLKDVAEGYLTIGAVSINDKTFADHRCNYTVKSINGVPAAEWAGETTPEHECDFALVTTIGATCTRDGYDYYRCTVCGATDKQNVVTAFGHTPKEDITVIAKPTCTTYGTSSRNCFVCKMRLETYHDDFADHTFESEWTVVTAPTCETEGKRTNTCSVCSAVVEEVMPAHNYEWVVKTEGSCLVAGVETQVCKDCGVEGETREIPTDGAHKFEASNPVIETIDESTDWFGKVTGVCTVCGETVESTEDVYANVEHFTDVKENHWFMSEVAYCVRQGYVSGMSETTFAPNNKLTRAQFLTLLAAFDGVDLTQYEGKDAGFEDVKSSHWWNEVICWAVENEYTSGISETKFGPNNNITRSQLARFFMVYTEKENLDVSKTADISTFPDAGKVQGWAEPAVKWAVAEGLIAGMSDGTLAPNGNATRAQAARIFMIYANTNFAVVEPPVCEHVWGEWVVTTEPTTEAAGEETRTCTLCGETESQPIDPIPPVACEHVWGEWVVTTEPTPEAAGVETATCTLCGETKTQEVPYVPAVCEHVWGDWTVTAPSTHTADGEETRTCTLCGEVETAVLPMHTADYTIRLFIENDWVAEGATIDGTEATELLLPICYGEDYNDYIGDFPTATLEGYEFQGWLLESYGFLMNEAEWNGNSYALTGDCELYAIFEEAAPVLPLYNENGVDGYLAAGTYDYDLAADYQYTIFELAPEEAGKYTIIANDSLVGIVSYNGMWVTTDPSAETVVDTTVEWDCTSVGQTLWVAVPTTAATANITVAFEAVTPAPEPIYVAYTNVVTPEAFTFDGDAAALVNVAYNDETVDVVVDVDGVYHLNTADGPVVYVNLADTKMNLSDAMSYGQLKSVAEVDGVTVTTSYNEAYAEYTACADANGLYPLTVDLVTILKEVGAYRGWYEGESAWVAATEDAWMFACYYVPAAVEPEPEAREFNLVFAGDEGSAIVNDATLEYTLKYGDKYSDVIAELPVAEKEGYVFKGWWNREYRIALTPDFNAEKVFELFIEIDSATGLPEEDIATMDNTIELIPIWDVEGEKTCTITFINTWVDFEFEPITYQMNVYDYYIAILCGEFPDPGVIWLDEWTKFQGWYIEELNYLFTEGDMWDLGYLALEGDWVFDALYIEE